MSVYMLRRPNTLRKYQDAELTLYNEIDIIQVQYTTTYSKIENSAFSNRVTGGVPILPYQDASRLESSIPRCNIGLNLNVRGKGTLAESTENLGSLHKTLVRASVLVKKPEKAQLIQPPITIMGSMFVRFPFIMSVMAEGSATATFS